MTAPRPPASREPPVYLALLISGKDAAERLGISIRMLYELARAGEIRRVRVGRRVLYSPTELQRWVESRMDAPRSSNLQGRDARP